MAIESFMSETGLKVYVEPINGMKNLDAKVIIETGSVDEPDELAGISHALEHCLFVSTRDFKDEQALRDYADEHAFNQNANTYYTRTIYTTLGLEGGPMFHALGDVAFQPRFGEAAVNKEMSSIRREAKTGLDEVGGLSTIMRDYVMFGLPYGRDVIGYSDRLTFDEATLRDYYETNYRLGRTALLVVGDITPGQVEALAVEHFDTSKYSREEKDRVVPEAKSPYEGVYEFGHLRKDSENAYLRISASRTPEITQKMRQKPWAYLSAVQAISRVVFDTLRVEKGLSYNGGFRSPGYNHQNARAMSATVTVDPENTDKALAALRDILQRAPSSYSDETLLRHLNAQRMTAAANVDGILQRSDFYIDNYIAHGLEPQSIDLMYDAVMATTLEDVRDALNGIYEIFQSSPNYETVTGPKQAMGKRAVVAQELFA